MTRGQVIEHFLRNLEYAQKDPDIKKPFSWALVITWGWVNENEKPRDLLFRKEVEDGNDNNKV